MPEKIEFAKFFSKYMLIFEGIKNRGIAFSPLIRKLIEAKKTLWSLMLTLSKSAI